MSADAPDSRRWLLALLLALLLLPLAAGTRVPSQDGPMHIENASILLRYHAAGEDELRRVYALNPELEPTWPGHLLLAALLLVVPAALAEKVMVAALVLALPLALAYMASALGGRAASWSAALIAMPFAWSYLLHMGFYAFSTAIPLAFLALGSWLRWKTASTVKVMLLSAMALVVWAFHPMGLVLLGVAMVAFGGVDLASTKDMPWTARIGARTPLVGGLVALVPAGLASLAFTAQVASARIVAQPFRYRLFTLLSLDTLVAYRRLESVIAGALAVVLVVALVAGLRLSARQDPHPRSHGALVLAALLAALALTAPNRLGELAWIDARFALEAWLALALWLSTRPWPPRAGSRLAAVCVAFALALVAARWPSYRAFARQLDEYTTAANAIPARATVLALSLAPRGITVGGEAPSWKVQPFLHAQGITAADRQWLDLANYEARVGLFPLLYRPCCNPYRLLGSPLDLERVPPRLDLPAFERRSGLRVDYVLLWGLRELPPSADRDALLAQLVGFRPLPIPGVHEHVAVLQRIGSAAPARHVR